jgi:hypothetical protein
MPIATSPRRRFALIAAAALAAVVVVLAVALLAGGGDAAPAARVVKGPHFIDADEPGVLTFENGDCFRDPEVNRAAGEPRLNTVECVGAGNEVFSFVELPDGAWDAAAVARAGTAGCTRQFRELWGEPGSGAAQLDVYAVLPTERSWTQDGDRSAMCVVYSRLGEFTVDPIAQGRGG